MNFGPRFMISWFDSRTLKKQLDSTGLRAVSKPRRRSGVRQWKSPKLCVTFIVALRFVILATKHDERAAGSPNKDLCGSRFHFLFGQACVSEIL